MRWAVINAEGLVTGVIVWDGETDYTPADGLTLVNVDDTPCGPGWTVVEGVFVAPPEPDLDGEEAT